MGNVKSFRMSDRIENMFNSIKKYNHVDITDTEILNSGIEMRFEVESQSHNPYYRKCICEYLNNKRLEELFNDICDIMETLSFSDGFFLEDEVKRFMTVVEADNFFDGYDDGKINFQQYNKAYEVIIDRKVYKEKDFQLLAQELQKYYEIKN